MSPIVEYQEYNRTRFPATDYYFMRNGREILVVIDKEYDVSDITVYGLAVLLDLRLSYVYNPEYKLKTFPDFIKKCIFDVRYSPVSINLSEVDTHSIFDALGIPYTPITHYAGLFWLKIKTFFQNIYNKIEKYISQSKAEWKDDWRKITEWEKRIEFCYKDLLGNTQCIHLFTITGAHIFWILIVILITAILAGVGFFGFVFAKSYATEKGAVVARRD